MQAHIFMSETLRGTKEKFERSAVHMFRKVRNIYDRNVFSPSVAKRISYQHTSATSFLDIGSGKGYLGEAIKKKIPSAQVISTDIEDGSHSGNTPFVISSASKLPFANKSFDLSTLFYVLHHMDFPEEALREAKRVSNAIVVHEDAYRKKWQKKLINYHVESFQREYGSATIGTSVKTDDEWQELFKREGLAVTKKRRIRNIRKLIYAVPQYEYHLTPVDVFIREETVA
jgi:ubiquinone/menaquinone biosynthesis C-methylase UbiE